jgi:hypothetical protein
MIIKNAWNEHFINDILSLLISQIQQDQLPTSCKGPQSCLNVLRVVFCDDIMTKPSCLSFKVVHCQIEIHWIGKMISSLPCNLLINAEITRSSYDTHIYLWIKWYTTISYFLLLMCEKNLCCEWMHTTFIINMYEISIFNFFFSRPK